MSYFRLKLFISILSFFSLHATTYAAPSLNQNLMYGFDWLHPENTKCTLLDKTFAEKLVKGDVHCKPDSSAFGVDLGVYFQCSYSIKKDGTKVAEDYEYLFYQSRKQCEEALATMNANAP